jgi:hypothetical protein
MEIIIMIVNMAMKVQKEENRSKTIDEKPGKKSEKNTKNSKFRRKSVQEVILFYMDYNFYYDILFIRY